MLVQSTVTFRVDVQSLVDPTLANNEEAMKAWFEDKAFKLLVDGHSSDTDSDYEHDVPVTISQTTADRYTDKTFGDATWSEIKTESNALQESITKSSNAEESVNSNEE